MGTDLKSQSVVELLQLHAAILNELIRREVLRTRNNPTGDYAEWCVANALHLELAGKSAAGFDAIDGEGVKYQIKGRRVTPENPSRQLSAIRNLGDRKFDYLVAIIFDENYRILNAIIVPHSIVSEYATYREHVNAHILHAGGEILVDPRVKDIRNLFGT